MIVYNKALCDDIGGGAVAAPDLARCLPFLLGRSAINFLIQEVGITRIFLPAFVCPMVIDIFLYHRCDIVLYDHIDSSLAVDTADLVALLERDRGVQSHFFWIDYWGLGRDIPVPVYEACRRQQVMTIVDALHTLPFGRYQADFVIYGARKLLNLPFGALLTAKSGRVSEHGGTRMSKWLLGALTLEHYLKASAYGFRRLDVKRFIARIDRMEQVLFGKTLNYDREDLFLYSQHIYPGLVAQMERRDLADIRRTRNRIFHQIARELETGLLLDESACPMGLPLVCDDRDRLRSHLWSNAIYTSTIWDKLHERVNRGGYEKARDLAARILTLPVNHDLNLDQIDFLLGKVRDFKRAGDHFTESS